MRELILMWLFGTDKVDSYIELLRESLNHCNDGIKHAEECIELIEAHKQTLKREEWFIKTVRDLIKVCEKHGIDIDKEIRLIHLEEVNANETLG